MTTYDRIIQGIRVCESEPFPKFVDMTSMDEFLFCGKFTSKFFLREEVCKKISEAQRQLPKGLRFLLYEAYRPLSRQIELWDSVLVQIRNENPEWTATQCEEEVDTKYVANPHGFGSGHLAGAAVDITLCTSTGEELFMGTRVQEFCSLTPTASFEIKGVERERRNLLRKTLEAVGVMNFPSEWWHFCYGDRLWAEITHQDKAFFAPVDEITF